MSDLLMKRRFEATLLYLKAHQLESFNRIEQLLADSSVSLDDISEEVETYAQLEGAFMTLQQTSGPILNPPPAPLAEPADPEPTPGEGSVTVTEENSPTLKRSKNAARVKKSVKKRASETEEE